MIELDKSGRKELIHKIECISSAEEIQKIRIFIAGMEAGKAASAAVRDSRKRRSVTGADRSVREAVCGGAEAGKRLDFSHCSRRKSPYWSVLSMSPMDLAVMHRRK